MAENEPTYEATYDDEAWFWDAYELGQVMVATEPGDPKPVRIRVADGGVDDESSYAEAYLSVESAERMLEDLRAKIEKAKAPTSSNRGSGRLKQ